MIVFPTVGFNSYIDVDYADEYFTTRIRGDAWFALDDDQKEIALISAYRKLCLLSLSVELNSYDFLASISQAQCEQALYEVKNDLDQSATNISKVDLDGVSIDWKSSQVKQYSEMAMALLSGYLTIRTVKRSR
ncbi:hypothetical protein [Fundidesulfovibrio putealis]|uniref:hypothetical protein n=1 Tax=Fundidesulfovibrio putealis TaxID=270496 RepID=UPI000480124D|nr:hypothetical protein [Fundidesulfovibrio putealis]